MILVTIGSLLAGIDTPVIAASLDPVRQPLFACFRRSDPSSCDRALMLTEALQQRAADRQLYSCQTLLLGLQADVVMTQLGEQRFNKAVITMRDSERLCAGL